MPSQTETAADEISLEDIQNKNSLSLFPSPWGHFAEAIRPPVPVPLLLALLIGVRLLVIRPIGAPLIFEGSALLGFGTWGALSFMRERKARLAAPPRCAGCAAGVYGYFSVAAAFLVSATLGIGIPKLIAANETGWVALLIAVITAVFIGLHIYTHPVRQGVSSLRAASMGFIIAAAGTASAALALISFAVK